MCQEKLQLPQLKGTQGRAPAIFMAPSLHVRGTRSEAQWWAMHPFSGLFLILGLMFLLHGASLFNHIQRLFHEGPGLAEPQPA